MNEALKLAIEKGGFEINEGIAFDAIQGASYAKNYVVLNPLFWQALGKALGWGTDMISIDEGGAVEWDYYAHCPVDGEIVLGDRDECPNECETENAPIISWLYHALQYHELNLTGGNTESFWKDLLMFDSQT